MTTKTVTQPRRAAKPAPPPNDDLFRYGWRYVRRKLDDGREIFEQVPLTLEDVLHPEQEDVIPHTDQHENIRFYLRGGLQAHLSRDPRARVFSDLRCAWDVPQARPLGPDVAVVSRVRKRRNWNTFDVAKEGVRPTLVIEITSPETRHLDLENKVAEYARVGIPLYVIIDIVPDRKANHIVLYGYQHTSAGYVQFLADARGWLWLALIGLWIGAMQGSAEEPGAVYLYDSAGNAIGDYTSIVQARAEAEARAAAAEAQAAAEARAAEAEARAAEVEARLRELEAELRRLRGEAS